jgi:hypothetical protein
VLRSNFEHSMSALGQKQTSRPEISMSALPQKRTLSDDRRMSALSQKETFAKEKAPANCQGFRKQKALFRIL